MVALRSPLIDLELDEQAALYVAHLERQLLAYQINDVKYRALLEFLTGDAWDDLAISLETKELKDIAIAAAQKKLGLTFMQAAKLVRQRQARANGLPDPTLNDPIVAEPASS